MNSAITFFDEKFLATKEDYEKRQDCAERSFDEIRKSVIDLAEKFNKNFASWIFASEKFQTYLKKIMEQKGNPFYLTQYSPILTMSDQGIGFRQTADKQELLVIESFLKKATYENFLRYLFRQFGIK